MGRPSARWHRMATGYLWLARHYPELDASPAAAAAMYDHESHGTPLTDPWANAYYVGKHWLDWQLNEWKAGRAEGTLTKGELLEDPDIPAGVKDLI